MIDKFIKQPKSLPLILAPMSGVSNSCFRRLIKKNNPRAVDLVVTEFISVEGLTRENKKSFQMLNFLPEERPIAIQIFGADLERMVLAAKIVEQTGADIVDINCGCPVPKVVKRGGGCELMRNAEHLGKILEAVKKAVTIPVTLKIRSGWDENSRNALEIGKMAQNCGISMLTIHGRTRTQLYRGLADWEIIGQVSQELFIPVIGSGDIINFNTADQAQKFGVSGLMIGRGAMLNPWVFHEIRQGFAGLNYQRPNDLMTVEILEDYLNLLLVDFSEKASLGKMKQFASQVTLRVKGSAEIRRKLTTAMNIKDMQEQLVRWKESLLSVETIDRGFANQDLASNDLHP